MASKRRRDLNRLQEELESGDWAVLERRSLYGLRQAEQRDGRKKSLLHRLVFLAKISPELADKRDLGEFWDRNFLNLQRHYQGDSVTGLLLLYPSYALHVLESTSDALKSVLKTLEDMNKEGNSALLLEPRILVMSHNIPSRLFHHWNYKLLNVPGSHLSFADHGEPLENIVSECLTKLLRLGVHLLKYPRASKNLPDLVIDKVPELIIPQATLAHLLQCKVLLTPAQYLQAYDTPLNIIMDSDIVWPAPVPIKPLEKRY